MTSRPAATASRLTTRRLAAETALVSGILAGGLSALVLAARAVLLGDTSAATDAPAVADAARILVMGGGL